MNVFYDVAKRFRRLFDVRKTVEYIHECCPEETAEVIRQADLLLENTFVFTDRWDMEPCPQPYKILLDDWLTSPNGDPEWIFMLNRHDFLNKLLQAYCLTDNRKYLEKLRWYLLDWIKKNPITLAGTDATRTIDTGIRCFNWIGILLHCLGGPVFTEQDAEKILDTLRLQIINMHDRYIGKYALSNWGILQTTAICAASIWFPECVPDDIATWSWEELKNQLSLQILEDGSHWEQSAMYHVEVLNICSKLHAHLLLAKELRIPITTLAKSATAVELISSEEQEVSAGPGYGFNFDMDGWLVQAIRVLNRHVLYTSDPSFNQLPQCDSDVTDVRDVMVRAAVLMPYSGIYRYAAGQWMDLDSVWLTGLPGIHAFYQRRPRKPDRKTWNCETAGNIYFRNSWSVDADFTWLKCSSLGSSHGHADQTHMSIYREGKPFLVDSGRYTYVEEDPLRTQLKSPCAHNVCVIDGQSGGEPDGSWSYHRYDETFKNYFREEAGAHYIEMGVHGVLSDQTPYLIKRKVLAVDDGIWLSVQDIICQGDHEVIEYFHMDNDVKVASRNHYIHLQNGGAKLNLYSLEPIDISHGVISKKYNEKLTAPLLTKSVTMNNRLTSQVLIADSAYKVKIVPVYQLRRQDPLPFDVASAWNIEKPDGTTYTMIVVNREICRGDKLFSCNGKTFYGKALVMKQGDSCSVIRLRT